MYGRVENLAELRATRGSCAGCFRLRWRPQAGDCWERINTLREIEGVGAHSQHFGVGGREDTHSVGLYVRLFSLGDEGDEGIR